MVSQTVFRCLKYPMKTSTICNMPILAFMTTKIVLTFANSNISKITADLRWDIGLHSILR